MIPADNFRTAPLAIIGMGCRLPGADNLDAFWSLLREGCSGIVTFPEHRLDQRLYYNPDRDVKETSYSRIGGIVPIQPWNRELCPLTNDDANQIDDVHRTMCEVAYAALRDAGYRGEKSLTPNTGVYIGNSSGGNLEADFTYHAHANELADLLREVGSADGIDESVLQNAAAKMAEHIRRASESWAETPVTDVTSSAAPRLIAESLRLTGPHFAVDAACASSFTALHLAAMALHAGRIDAAIVGAFSFRNWFEMVLLSPTQTVSPNGSCPFDAAADGMVPSDGYAAIIVKTLQQAIDDGDRIDGVVRAMGVSSDGRGKGFWAPRQQGQVAAIRRAYASGFDPSRLQYVECHATSTQLGDATEMATLKESLADSVSGQIPIGGVKSNLGHTLEVAGMQGLMKTLLAMKHGLIPPSINCRKLNPEIDWANQPFRVATEQAEWPPSANGQPRCAGVNAFGIGGLNVHVVVEDGHVGEHLSPRPSPAKQDENIAVIGFSESHGDSQLVEDFSQLAGLQSVDSSSTTGDLDFDWKKHRIPPKEVAVTNPLQLMLLDAAVTAMENAGYGKREYDRSRVGTVVGSPFTSDFSCDAFLGARLPEIRETIANALSDNGVEESVIAAISDQFAETLLDRKPAARDVTASLSSSTLASRIAKHLDLMGGAFAVDAGAETAKAALQSAADLLQSGTCDLVLCGVGQRMTDIAFMEQLAANKGPEVLRDHGKPGVGAAVIALKRAADARRDGDTILSLMPGDAVKPSTEPINTTADAVGTTSEIADAMTPNQSASLLKKLEDTVVEMTGLPRPMIKADADLAGDLGLDLAAKAILRDVAVADGAASVDINQCRTLNDLVNPAATEHSSDVAGSSASKSQPFNRFVLRTMEAKSDPTNAWTLNGPALILGDNPVATALRERLTAEKNTVHQLSASGGIDDLLSEVERLCAQQTIPHLFLTTSRDDVSKGPVSQRSLLPFLVCRLWYDKIVAAGQLEKSSLVAINALGGDFGISGRVDSPDGVTGLLKSLDRETEHRLQVRIVDAPANEPAKMIAAAVMRELATETSDIETATVRGKRHVVRAVRQSADSFSSDELAEGSIWLATGSGGETTARIVRDLGKRLGIQWHLLEPGPLPAIDDSLRRAAEDDLKSLKMTVMREARAAGNSPLEAWAQTERALQIDRTLRSCHEAGVTAVLHECDLSDQTELATVFTKIQQSEGPITGVLHGGGYGIAAAGQFRKKNRETVERLLRERVDSAATLLNLTADHPLAYFIAVSSLHGRNGESLQTDIATAEEALAKLVSGYQFGHPDCKAVTLELAVNVSSSSAEIAIDAMRSKTRDSELLYREQRERGAELSERYDDLKPLLADAALVDLAYSSPNGDGIADITFDPIVDPFLNGHLDDGVPLLPAVAGIETCAQAASVWSGGRTVLSVHNQQIQNGFRMAGAHAHRARVLIEGDGDTVGCRLLGEFFDKTGKLTDPHRVYQTCSIDLADAPREIPSPDLGPVPDDWIAVPYPEDWREMATADSGTVFYGPELRSLKFVSHRPEGSWGRLIAPPNEELGGSRRGSRWHTPAALLDATLFLCDLHAAETFGTRQLPHVIDRIDFGRLPVAGEDCVARVVFRAREGRRITWDFWVLGADGAVLIQTQGFHVVTLREPPPNSQTETLVRH